MNTVERYLCAGCVKNMEKAQLIFKKIPGTEGERKPCSWCGRVCYGAVYGIKYGRGKKHGAATAEDAG